MVADAGEHVEQHLTAAEVQRLLGFIQRFHPIIVGGQAVNLWATLYYGINDKLDALGALTSKDIDFYHNLEAEKELANSLENGLLEIPDGDNHTPNAAVVKGRLGDRDVIIDFLAHIKGVDDKSLLENSVTIADAENPEAVSITIMHPLDCVRSRLSNINTLGRHSDHSLRQAAASLLILDCYINEQLSDLENKTAIKRAKVAFRELEFIIRNMHIGKTTEWKFGDQLQPISILVKYLDDLRLDAQYRSKQIKGMLNRLQIKQEIAERRRNKATEQLANKKEMHSRFSQPKLR